MACHPSPEAAHTYSKHEGVDAALAARPQPGPVRVAAPGEPFFPAAWRRRNSALRKALMGSWARLPQAVCSVLQGATEEQDGGAETPPSAADTGCPGEGLSQSAGRGACPGWCTEGPC